MPLRLAALAAIAATAFAGEYAVLANGSSLRIDRHENTGQNVRLFANGGEIELPAKNIVRFESEYVAPAIQTAAPSAPVPADAKKLVTDEARRWNIPPALLRAVAGAESGFNPNAVSPKGAIGVMQLMPETARQLGADPKDPRQNVQAGTAYLADLLRKYQDDPYQVRKALAAYNAGPNAVQRYNGIPPYRETIQYIERVIKQWQSTSAK